MALTFSRGLISGMLSAAAIIVAIVVPSHTGPYSLGTMAKLETHANGRITALPLPPAP